MESRSIKLSPFLEYGDLPDGVRPDLLGVGAKGSLVFPIQRADGKCEAICILNPESWHHVQLNKPLKIDHVQTLSGNRLLLVRSRCGTLGDTLGEVNAYVVDQFGEITESFCLGDGISHVQATRKDVIWVAYFDEGVQGTSEWRQPIGASGLVAWDANGNRLYDLDIPPELPSVVDGFALDVSKSEVWFSYYPEFPLVFLKDNHYVDYWRCPVVGAHSIVSHEGRVLYSPGFGKDTQYRLFQLGENHCMKPLGAYKLTGWQDEPLHHCRVRARGSRFFLVGNHGIYRLDIENLG